MDDDISISSWLKNESGSRPERASFLDKLQEGEEHIAYDSQKAIHNEVFSKINCLDCGNYCKTTPPIYTKKDVKRIARHIGITPKTFIRKYTIEDIGGELTGIKVPCHFLNEDNTCSIYEVRPEACRRYPHTDEKEFAERPEMAQYQLFTTINDLNGSKELFTEGLKEFCLPSFRSSHLYSPMYKLSAVFLQYNRSSLLSEEKTFIPFA